MEPTVEGLAAYLQSRPPNELSNPDMEETFWTVGYLRHSFKAEAVFVETRYQCATISWLEDKDDQVVQLPMAICNFFDEEERVGDAITAEDALHRLHSIDRKVRQNKQG